LTVPLTLVTIAIYAVLGAILAFVVYRLRSLAFRGIPHFSAQAMGLFRIAFGVMLTYGFLVRLSLPDTPALGGTPGEAELWRAWGWVEWLSLHVAARDAVGTITVVALVLFTVGLVTRAAYAVAAVGLVVWLLVAQEYGSVSHAWAPHAILLVALLIVPWGEGLTVDEWLRRRRGRSPRAGPPGPRYGLSVWLPGLVLGTAWLAAALSKLVGSGLAWVTGGAVRYHWAEDFLSAPTSWGAWIAGHDPLPVLFSGAGLGVEALFILHVFFRHPLARLGFGLLAASLLLGFYLFQGVFWYGWWMLLIAFLPWEAIARRLPLARLGRRAEGREGMRLRPGLVSPVLAVLVAAILTQQAAISLASVEQMPFFTNYPMYSWTFESPEQFNARVAPTKFYRAQVTDMTGGARRDITDQAYDVDMRGPLSAAVVEALGDDAPSWTPKEIRNRLTSARELYEHRYGERLRRVEVRLQRRVFDFDGGGLRTVGVDPPVVIDLAALERGEDLAAAALPRS
jgi:hypothetical protein